MAGLFPFSFSHCRCEVVLGEFLKETKKNPSSVKFAEMANILVIHCQTTGKHVAAPWTASSLEAPSPRPGQSPSASEGAPWTPSSLEAPSPCPGQSPGGSERHCDGGSWSRGAPRTPSSSKPPSRSLTESWQE